MIDTTSAFPVSRASSIPTVSAAEMAEVDGLAIDEFGIDLLQMIEQAGSHLAELVRAEVGGDLRSRRVIVAVGPGNNGGGGLAAARHLVNRGASVRVILARPVNRSSEAGPSLRRSAISVRRLCSLSHAATSRTRGPAAASCAK